MKENNDYLTTQILTYIGNKRKLLNHIGEEIEIIQKQLNKDKLITLDLFSGSGIVARYLKQYSSCVYANDLETYSRIINECYLSNKSEFDLSKYKKYISRINNGYTVSGIIRNNYSPIDENNIIPSDRVFYTNDNATYIDTVRYYIDELVDDDFKKYLLARLLVESSIHTNTAGIFKGFYKDKNTKIGKFGGTNENALERIKGKICIDEPPVLSEYETDYQIFQKDANELVKEQKNIDVVYIDPPYNQHPYGSNYFMLNIIANNKIDSEISKVSGIPTKWNHSGYNNKKSALLLLEDIISNIDAAYLIISYNNEGFIKYDEMIDMLGKYGKLKIKTIEYNTFRGCRNLKERELKTNEYLFVLKKDRNNE